MKLVTGIILALSSVSAFGFFKTDPCPVIPEAKTAGKTRPVKVKAISLKVLQQNLKRCHGAGSCDPAIYRLYGITKLLGFVVDRKNRDLVIYGTTEAGEKALLLEDFVTTLRNAYMKYARRRGRTIIYTPPAVSIDPQPGMNLRLHAIKQKLNGSRGARRDRLEAQYRKVCTMPMKNRVLGMPWGTSARLALAVDHNMKLIVNGQLKLGIPGLKAVTQMRYEYINDQVKRGHRRIKIPASSQDRYWFHAGEHRFRKSADGNNYFVNKSSVILLTANQHMTRTGKLRDSRRQSPFSQTFAKCFSRRYQQVAQKLKPYRQLAALYRQTAVTRLIRTVRGIERSGLNADYLLSGITFKPVQVPRTYPGVCRIKRYTLRNNQKRTIGFLTSQSCGGVSMAVKIRPRNIRDDRTGSLKNAVKSILQARPDWKTVVWSLRVVLPVAWTG